MGIDLFTLAAEILNFLILVFLLQRFLYRPITHIMAEREKTAVSRLREAEEKRNEAEHEKRTYEEKIEAIEREREALLEDALQESKRHRQHLISETKLEIEELRRTWRETVDFEREAFLQDLREQIGAEIVNATRVILHDMANQELEEHVVSVFVERLRGLDETTSQRLSEAITSDTHSLRIESAFELSEGARTQVAEALQSFLKNGHLKYEVKNDLLCGIRIATDEYEIAWSFDHYISALQQRFQHSLDEKVRETAHERGEKHPEGYSEKHADGV